MVDTTWTDPLGRSITLHDRTWYGHVIKGHPDVVAHRHLAEEAIRRPEQVRTSSSDPGCRKYIGPGPRPSVKMVVIADVAMGIVKTAYLSRRITGEIEWPSEPT